MEVQVKECQGLENGYQTKYQNMANNFMILKEIRIGSFSFFYENGKCSYEQDSKGVNISSEETNTISHWMSDLASYFLFVDEKPIEILNTKVLNCSFMDVDSNFIQDIEVAKSRIKLGEKESYNHFGHNVILMSRNEFNNLSTDEKKSEYLMNSLDKSLKNYFSTFEVPFQGFEVKIKKLNAYGWFVPITKKIPNKDNSCSIVFEKKYGRFHDEYRLKYKIINTNEIKYIVICTKLNLANIFKSKPYYYYLKENPLAVPAYIFENFKWVKDNLFSFHWGDEEKYIFNPKTLEISKTIISKKTV